jgi:hypothetical protein
MKKDEKELLQLLDTLILEWENEVVEFKKAGKDYPTDKFGKASREEIDKLILDKLSDALDLDQRKKKVANLLTKLRRAGVIRNRGPKKAPEWVIAE